MLHLAQLLWVMIVQCKVSIYMKVLCTQYTYIKILVRRFAIMSQLPLHMYSTIIVVFIIHA